MSGGDGLATPRPEANAPEDLAGPAMGWDGELTDRWRQVGEPSGREQGPDLVPATTGDEERP